MSEHAFTIDRDRLHDLLGGAQEAAATMRGIREEREEIRDQLSRLKMAARNTQESPAFRGHDLPKATVTQLQALERQLERITRRQGELNTALSPKVELGRRAVSYAKQNGLANEVHNYAL